MRSVNEYTYDALRNLSLEVTLSTGTIRYTYDAAGYRLTQRTEDAQGTLISQTDYLGAFEYHNGELSLVHHSEGRVSFAQGTTGNYHFDLRDHLGNVRVTFSDQPITTTATATMETSAAPTEEAIFMGVAESRHTLAFHNTTTASSEEPMPNKVATLLPGEQGPAKSVAVHAGDQVHLEVNARYETLPAQVQGLEGVATQVAGALQQTAAGLESAGAARGSNGLAAGGALATSQEQEVPKAYLNYLLYDEDFKLIDQGFRQVSEAAAVGEGNPKASPEALTLDVAVEEDGFLYTYLSNEPNGSSRSAVYFDDFTVEQQSYIVAVNDFYPFGGSHDQESMIGVANKYKYQGKELIAELELGLYDFHARQYDPMLGRFMRIDPLAMAVAGMSPYAGMGNNPVIYVDPDGNLFFVPILIGAAIGGAINLGIQAVQGNINSVGDGFAAFGIGALAGGVAVAAPQLIGSIAGVGLTTATGGVAAGFVPGAVTGGIGGALNNFGNALYFQDATLGEASVSGLQGLAIGTFTGGLIGGGLAKLQGKNFWGPQAGQGQVPQVTQISERPRALKVSTEVPEPTIKQLPNQTPRTQLPNAVRLRSGDLRQVGKFLESVEDVMTNPELLRGRSLPEVRALLQKSNGWINDVMRRSTTNPGGGWVLRELNKAGTDFTGRIIQYHPGTLRHFGGAPYWKVSSGSGTIRIPLNP